MADVLGRVERLERAGQHLAGHARTGVGDADRHILPRHHLGLRRRVALVEIGVGGLDRQLAALGHGVARVDGEIEDADLELGRDRRSTRHMPPASTVSMATCSPSVRRRRSDMPVTRRPSIDRLGLERLTAREGQQALGQRGRPLRAAHGVVDRAGRADRRSRGRRPGALRCSGFEIADDDGQEVVEIVRDAARELADALHLLRLRRAAPARAAAPSAPRAVRVMSRVILAKPSRLPSLSRMRLMTTLAQNCEPSLRTRKPSASNLPSRSAVSSARAGMPAARSSVV